ncbi:MAG: glycoside hydrolase family 97 protein [Saprospiraceae bacterium]
MIQKTKFILLLAIAILFNSCDKTATKFIVKSPNEDLSVIIENKAGKIIYTVLSSDQTLVNPSEVSIFTDQLAQITGATERSESNKWKPTWGQFSEVDNQFNELVLDIDFEKASTKLITRVFDDGLGFRYELIQYEAGSEATLYCEYKVNPTDALYSPSGEREPLGPISINDLAKAETLPRLKIPIVVESNQAYLSIMESDLFSAPGFKVMNSAFDTASQTLVSANKITLSNGNYTTPWRVILVNEKIGDLLTNRVPLNLAKPLQIEDVSWIQPGKTLWDWRVHGYTTEDGFTYGANTESYKRFIDFADEMEIDYFLIDNDWYKQASKGSFEPSDELDLPAVIKYANEKEVNLMLYYDRRNGEYGDEALFPYYQSLGMKGIKYGFMADNVPFTKTAIQQSAESHLLIDFHDGPVPFTGIERTYPNAVTREYCHAQQDARRAFTPEAFIKMALINAIQGPLDMNNGSFDLTGINSGEREKGPRIKGSYISTVASEAARTLIIFSGLVCIPDAPEAYREKADLFEFIQKQPVGQWDESKILHAKMGEYITTARRHGDQWFIGSAYNQKGGTLEIALDFLEAGKTYQITYYEDTAETHGKTNPEAYQVRTGTIKKGDIVEAKMASGGGHCMWIR